MAKKILMKPKKNDHKVCTLTFPVPKRYEQLANRLFFKSLKFSYAAEEISY